MNVLLCLYIRTCVYFSACTYICVLLCLYVHMCAFVLVRTCVCAFVLGACTICGHLVLDVLYFLNIWRVHTCSAYVHRYTPMYICTTNVCVCVCVCVCVRVRVNVSTCRKFTLKCIMYIFVILFHHFVPFHILTSVQSIFVCLYLTRGTTVALLLCANCNNNSNSENCRFVLN